MEKEKTKQTGEGGNKGQIKDWESTKGKVKINETKAYSLRESIKLTNWDSSIFWSREKKKVSNSQNHR